MDILVPIDGSDCSLRALSFAAGLAHNFSATLDVVHFSDAETEATDRIRERAAGVLDEKGVEATPRVVIDDDLGFRPGDRIAEDILDLVREHGYDHVVMGHHGQGTMDRVMLGSAAERLVQASVVPVTVVP
ncbi:universal stress protein [Halobacteriaceae archaeon GCM10025711]